MTNPPWAAMEAIRELLAPYDFYIDSSVGDSQADSLADEMGIILAVAGGYHRAGAAADFPPPMRRFRCCC